MDRRSLLKSAVAFTAAAALPATLAASEVVTATPAAVVAVPVKLKPYTDYVWEWFVSNDGEVFHESFATKEEAIEYAKECDYSIVAECKPQDFDLGISAGWVLEQINENNYDRTGEDEGVTATRDQELDLECMLKSAVEAWVVKHGIDIRAWAFAGMRDETHVDLPATA